MRSISTRRLCFILMGICFRMALFASGTYTSFTINHLQGLSNSAVLDVFKDSLGLMWLGTYDGLNCYDSREITVYRTDFSKERTLDNNIISRIQDAGNRNIWVQSFSGINLFSTDSLSVIDNYHFSDEETLIHSNRQGNSWVLGNKHLYYYNTYHKRFIKILELNFRTGNLRNSAFVDSKGVLHVIPDRGTQMFHFALNSFSKDSAQTKLQVSSSSLHAVPIVKTYSQNGIICFIDSTDDLYFYDVAHKSKVYIRNVRSLVEKYGSFVNILSFHDDILIMLHTGGLLRLTASNQYSEERFREDLRIFSVYVDSSQGILWLGTDGAGAVKLAQKNTLVTNLILEKLSPTINGQVRGIMTDKEGTLWIGTKGDGLLRIPHYQDDTNFEGDVYSPKGKYSFSAYARKADFYPVFSLKKKRRSDDFWVGMADSVLYYYSYEHDKLLPVRGSMGNRVAEIHGVYEENDSILWLATLGSGIIKVSLDGKSGYSRAKKTEPVRCFSGQEEVLEFSSVLVQGDSVLWFGSRGKGLVKYALRQEKFQVYSLCDMLGKAVDDILCLCAYDADRFFVGTTAGLVSVSVKDSCVQPVYIGREQGLFNEMIHGIVKDGTGMLWLGTNRGMIKYDPVSGGSYTYYYSKGIEIGEFSDDSYYRCPYTGNIFLGGVNGLLWLDSSRSSALEYYPPLVLRRLVVDRKEASLDDFYSPDRKAIVLSEGQNTFSLQFVALDYLNPDIEYAYILEGYSDKWSFFSKENEAVFHRVPPGEYLFRVRYKKDVLDTVYEEYSVAVKIVPYWYHSQITYTILVVIVVLLLTLWMYRLHRKGFFDRLALAWAASREELQAKRQAEAGLVESALGKWAADFPNCRQPEQIRFVERFIETLDENISREDLGSTFMAEKMNMSTRQFYRKVKELSGLPPSDFIKKYRLERASQLLLETDLTIQEVIESIGISSRPYFYKEFSRRYGTTPKLYREQHKNAR